MIVRATLPLVVCVALACTRSAPPRQAVQSATTDSVARDSAATADTIAVRVTGPTLIAFYPVVTQTQIDTTDTLSTIFDDFSFHLSTAQDSLRAAGYSIVQRPYDSVRVVEGSTSRRIVFAPDSVHIGYVFIAPGRRERVWYGVTTNSDLIAIGHSFLR